MTYSEDEESVIQRAEMELAADDIESAHDVTQSEAELATALTSSASLASGASDFERFESYVNVSDAARRHREGLTHASRLDWELHDILDSDEE